MIDKFQVYTKLQNITIETYTQYIIQKRDMERRLGVTGSGGNNGDSTRHDKIIRPLNKYLNDGKKYMAVLLLYGPVSTLRGPIMRYRLCV